MRKPKKLRLTYFAHDEAIIVGDWKARVSQGSPAFDYLSEICMERVDGQSEFERGVAEGRRRVAGDIIGMILSDERASDAA